MYIYADESGHSGRHIFNEPEFYRQGALLSITDPEPILQNVRKHYCDKLGLSSLHANEIPPTIVAEIADAILDAMDEIDWTFHITIIQKPYLASTKSVDSIFDSGENVGARFIWYNHEFFRHTLCILFDKLFTDADKHQFWAAYLKDDYEGIKKIIQIALKNLNLPHIDKRLFQIAKDGLEFALSYPHQITLLANKGKKSYKGHTPNMIAFSSLIHAVHRFCKSHKVSPKAFYHDSQSEFASTMKEYHKLFSSVRFMENNSGWPSKLEDVNYDLGKISISSSKELSSLQAVDIFLWLSQRDNSVEIQSIKKRLDKYNECYYITRSISELIVYSWFLRFSKNDLSPEQLKIGKDLVEKMESRHFERVEDFLAKQSGDDND